jgi:hypothetical protein
MNTIFSALTNPSAMTTLQADATQAAEELKLAIKAQLAMQAISTLGVLFLCFMALEDSNRRKRS